MVKNQYWHLKLIGCLYGIVLSPKQKLFSEHLYLGDSLPRGVFRLSILTWLLIKLKVNTRHKPDKQSICYDSKDSQLPLHYSWIITSFAKRSTTKRTIEEIWGSKATSKKPWKSMSHKTTSGKAPSKFAIFFHLFPCYLVYVNSQVRSSTTVVWSFWAILVSSKRNIRTFNLCYWGKHVKETMC